MGIAHDPQLFIVFATIFTLVEQDERAKIIMDMIYKESPHIQDDSTTY